MITKQIIVKGIVQGVGYRYYAQKHASILNIAGYAMNMPDGSVSVIAQGDAGDVKAFIDQLRAGPLAASVDRLDIQDLTNEETFMDFEVF